MINGPHYKCLAVGSHAGSRLRLVVRTGPPEKEKEKEEEEEGEVLDVQPIFVFWNRFQCSSSSRTDLWPGRLELLDSNPDSLESTSPDRHAPLPCAFMTQPSLTPYRAHAHTCY